MTSHSVLDDKVGALERSVIMLSRQLAEAEKEITASNLEIDDRRAAEKYLEGRLAHAEAKYMALAAAARDCADDLEDELRMRYDVDHQLLRPDDHIRFDLDIAVVNAVRALLHKQENK